LALLGQAALVVVLATGAAPQRYVPLALVDQPLPVPPVPPPSPRQKSAVPQNAPASSSWTAFAPAPVPDSDLDNPTRPLDSGHVELTPGFVHPFYKSRQGDGYTPYSTLEEGQHSRYRPVPGLNLSVPLE
jgi:hypothetical protein